MDLWFISINWLTVLILRLQRIALHFIPLSLHIGDFTHMYGKLSRCLHSVTSYLLTAVSSNAPTSKGDKIIISVQVGVSAETYWESAMSEM
jgi:hypothetical protein